MGLLGYLVVMALLFFFVFVLANVNADRELAVDFTTAVDDLNWAVLIGAIYWANGLLTRSIVMGPLLVLRTITDLAARLAPPHQPRTGAVPASSR